VSEPRDQWLVAKLMPLRVYCDTVYDGMWDEGSVGVRLGIAKREPGEVDRKVYTQDEWVRLSDVIDALGLKTEDFQKWGKP